MADKNNHYIEEYKSHCEFIRMGFTVRVTLLSIFITLFTAILIYKIDFKDDTIEINNSILLILLLIVSTGLYMNYILTKTIIQFEYYISKKIEDKIDSTFFKNYLKKAETTSTQTFSRSIVILFGALNIVPIILYFASNGNFVNMNKTCNILSLLIGLVFIINLIFIILFYEKRVKDYIF